MVIEEANYTPTGTWTTNVRYFGRYVIRRTWTGFLLNAKIRMVCTGAPGSGNLSINWAPPGWEYDSSAMPRPIGYGAIDDFNVAERAAIMLNQTSAASAHAQVLQMNTPNASTLYFVTPTSPLTLGQNDNLMLQILELPVKRA